MRLAWPWRRDRVPASPGAGDWVRAIGLFLAAGLLIEFLPIDLALLAVSAALLLAGHGFFTCRRWFARQVARVTG